MVLLRRRLKVDHALLKIGCRARLPLSRPIYAAICCRSNVRSNINPCEVERSSRDQAGQYWDRGRLARNEREARKNGYATRQHSMKHSIGKSHVRASRSLRAGRPRVPVKAEPQLFLDFSRSVGYLLCSKDTPPSYRAFDSVLLRRFLKGVSGHSTSTRNRLSVYL